jgi:hypothetical protein
MKAKSIGWNVLNRGPKMANPEGTAILKYSVSGEFSRLHGPIEKIIRVEKDKEGQTWVWAVTQINGISRDLYIREVLVPALEKFTVHMSETCEVLGLQHHNGFTYLWVLEDELNEVRYKQEFLAFKTGADCPYQGFTRDYEYVGFYFIFIQMELGLYVFRSLEGPPGS